MANHYFLTSSFPAIEVGVEPELPLIEFWPLLEANLNKQDMQEVDAVRRYHDIQNLRLHWLGEPLDGAGKLTDTQIEEALFAEAGLPEYVFDFTRQYTETEERLRYFPKLVATFFIEEIAMAKGLLQEYLTFEREWRLVMLGFRAKQLGRDVGVELQYEDASEDLVAQILAQKDAKNYEPPMGYEDLKPLFESRQQDPLALHRGLSEYRFNRIADMVDGHIFSMDRVVAYLVRLIIVERWFEMNKEHGKVIVDEIVKGEA